MLLSHMMMFELLEDDHEFATYGNIKLSYNGQFNHNVGLSRLRYFGDQLCVYF